MAIITVRLIWDTNDVTVDPNPVNVRKDDEVTFLGPQNSHVFVVFRGGSPFVTVGGAAASGVQVQAPRVHKVPGNTSVQVVNVDEGDQAFECHLVDATGVDHIGKGGGETHPIKTGAVR